MLWYSCHLEGRPLLQNAIQNRFETIFTAAGEPREMLLIEQAHSAAVSTLWMRLPDAKFASAFSEFELGDESNLPREAALLIGHNPEFEKLFEFGNGD
jgi:hypothetical protein